MKIFFAVVVIVLLFVIGATLYVYKKSAMFLPALLGICGFPKIRKAAITMKTDISVRERGRTKLDFSCSIRYSAVLNICFSMWRTTC